MPSGKIIRMNRVFDEKGVCIIFAGCHHMTSKTIYPGQDDVCKAIELATNGGATCVNISKGFIKKCASKIKPHIAVLNYLPVYPAFSKVNPIKTVVSSTIEEALINGADGVVTPVDFYSEDAEEEMKLVADLVRECDRYGMVFIVEAEFPTFYDSNEENIKKYGADYLMFATRLCSELGVDVISTNYTGDFDSFVKIIDFAKIPVLINGGTVVDQYEFLKMIEIVNKAGAKGCLIGRNISEAPDPEKMTKAIGTIFRENISADQAFNILK